MLDDKYADRTEDNIHDELLESVDDSYEKTQGNPIYDVFKALAIQLAILWAAIRSIISKRDVNNLEDDELDMYVEQNSYIKRKLATYAYCENFEVVGTGSITEDDIFETESGIQYHPDQTYQITGSQIIKIICSKAGTVGNVPTDAIRFMPATIQGITSVRNLEAAIDGFDKETDAELRIRFFEAKQTPATSGNKHHYLTWAKDTSGVGDAVVLSLERGANTVEIVVVDRNFEPASSEVVAEAQLYIDPNSEGKGEGEAPIGAHAYVISATALTINVGVTVVPAEGYTLEQVQENLETALETYYKTLFKSSSVSYAMVGKIVIDTEGIDDYADLLINDGSASIQIPMKYMPVVGDVIVS